MTATAEIKIEQNEQIIEYSKRYEVVLIGMMVNRPSLIDYIESKLRQEHFYDRAIGKLYLRLCDMRAAGSTINRETAAKAFASIVAKAGYKMGREATSDDILQMQRTFDSWYHDNFDTGYNRDPTLCWQYAIKQVVEGFKRRTLMQIAEKIHEDLRGAIIEPDEIIERLQSSLSSVEQVTIEDETKSVSKVIADVAIKAKTLKDQQREIKFMRFGATDLDRLTGPMIGGTLTVIAARPGVGKTILGIQTAMHNSSLGKSMLFASLEMSHEQLSQRIITAKTPIKGNDLRLNRLHENEIKTIADLAADYEGFPFSVYAPSESVTIEAISAKARFMVGEPDGLSAIIVDYLGLIRLPSGRQELRDKLGDAAKKLRNLGKELGVPILLLAQLNREAAKTNTKGRSKPPEPSQIADSDQIQRHADNIVLIHQDGNRFPIIVAKNRAGERGVVDSERDAKGCRFITAGDQGADYSIDF